jgi:hypothetical protein
MKDKTLWVCVGSTLGIGWWNYRMILIGYLFETRRQKIFIAMRRKIPKSIGCQKQRIAKNAKNGGSYSLRFEPQRHYRGSEIWKTQKSEASSVTHVTAVWQTYVGGTDLHKAMRQSEP